MQEDFRVLLLAISIARDEKIGIRIALGKNLYQKKANFGGFNNWRDDTAPLACWSSISRVLDGGNEAQSLSRALSSP